MNEAFTYPHTFWFECHSSFYSFLIIITGAAIQMS